MIVVECRLKLNSPCKTEGQKNTFDGHFDHEEQNRYIMNLFNSKEITSNGFQVAGEWTP